MRQGRHTYRFLFLGVCLCCISFASGQDEKNRVRVSLGYTKVMPATSALTITAKYRAEEGIVATPGLDFEVFRVLEADSMVLEGSARTNSEGEAVFKLKNLNSIQPDSSGIYTYRVVSLEHPDFSEAEKDISFREALLDIGISTADSIPQLTATLTDAYSGEALEELPLRVQVQRLFRPLRIGEEFYMTDSDGSVTVPVEPGIPGLDGLITLEVVLAENDDYGSVKALVETPVGEPIKNLSTFNKRTMWSPPSKTPLFLLIVPNLLILGIWGAIVFLVINLFKIYKSKN